MIHISSEAGRRLAETQAELDAVTGEPFRYANAARSMYHAKMRRDEAAEALARELIAAGFADMEGD